MLDCVHDIHLPRSWFAPREPEESDEILAERRLIEIAMLERVFGQRLADIRPAHLRLADALMREVAPQHDNRTSRRPRGLRLLIGDAPLNDANCPIEMPSHQPGPVVFWGNYGNALRGPGRSIYGSFRGGWVVQCGYASRSAPMFEHRRKVPEFLTDLADVAGPLGVRVVGHDRSDGQSLSLDQMQYKARFEVGIDQLLSVRLHVSPSGAYLRRWWRYFAQRGDFSSPVRGRGCCLGSRDVDVAGLFSRLDALGINQTDLATVLWITPGYVCRFKRGKCLWPRYRWEEATTFVAAAESHVVATISGGW